MLKIWAEKDSSEPAAQRREVNFQVHQVSKSVLIKIMIVAARTKKSVRSLKY
jgi:hypothetical protein